MEVGRKDQLSRRDLIELYQSCRNLKPSLGVIQSSTQLEAGMSSYLSR